MSASAAVVLGAEALKVSDLCWCLCSVAIIESAVLGLGRTRLGALPGSNAVQYNCPFRENSFAGTL